MPPSFDQGNIMQVIILSFNTDGRRFTQNVPGGWRVRWKLVCSRFDLCLFINMRVPDMLSTVCPRLVISSRRAAIAPCAEDSYPCLHTLDESQFPFSCFDAPFSLLCLDTVAKATTHDHFLFLIIYQ